MPITIKEALKLKSLAHFKLIAGYEGIMRNIEKMGILEYETHENIEEKFGVGDFVITSLFAFKDNPQMAVAAIKSLIRTGVEGLAVKNVYYDDLSDEIKNIADENAFPIFIFGQDVFFEDIITDVMNAIKEKNDDEILSTKVYSILHGNLSKMMIRRLAYEINSSFKETIITAYCKEKMGIQKKAKSLFAFKMDENMTGSVVKLAKDILIIYSFEENKDQGIMEKVLNHIRELDSAYHIGMSEIHNHLDELDICIKESMYACQAGKINDRDITYFKDIGIYKLLIPVANNPWMLRYHDDMIHPIVIYDKKYNTHLLDTAIQYVENNGDIKETAKALYQHGNTIRYRLSKIKEILDMDHEDANFYEQLSIAIRIYKMLDAGL